MIERELKNGLTRRIYSEKEVKTKLRIDGILNPDYRELINLLARLCETDEWRVKDYTLFKSGKVSILIDFR